MENWILTAIRQRCRRRIAAWLLGFAAAAAAVFHVYVITSSPRGGPGSPSTTTTALVVGILALLMFMVAAYERATWKGAWDPASHPVFQRIRSWGDVEGTAAAIRRELSTPRFRALRGWSVTDSFLVQSHPFTFDAYRYEDVWAARTGRTWHTQGGHLPIPFLQAFHEVVVLCPGRELHLEGRRQNVERMLAFMEQHPRRRVQA